MGVKSLSVLLVDDHPIIHLGLRMLLRDTKKFTLCGNAPDVATAKSLAAKLKPDIIVLDMVLGGRDGVELIRDLVETVAGTRIVVYSLLDEMREARRAFRAGAMGYVMKSAGMDSLRNALDAVARGESYASSGVQHALLDDLIGKKKAAAPGSPLDFLSDREFHVFRLLGAGLTSAEIAAELSLSRKTVSTYRERLKNKLFIDTGRELEQHARDYFRTGKLGPDKP